MSEFLFDDVSVSRETMQSLDRYVELLRKWSPAINLVAKSTIDDAWRRHFLDSVQIWPLVPENAVRLVDLGSGAGFPGLVMASLMKDHGRQTEVVLVESDRRKATFLREAAREMDVTVTVLPERAESLDIECDVVTARGFTALDRLLEIASPILRVDGIALLHKGARYESELTEAVRNWHMETQVHESRIDSASVILRIGGLRRRGERS